MDDLEVNSQTTRSQAYNLGLMTTAERRADVKIWILGEK